LILAIYFFYDQLKLSKKTTLALFSLPLGIVIGTRFFFPMEQRDKSILTEKQTFYHRIQIREVEQDDERVNRYLLLDTTLEGGQSFFKNQINHPSYTNSVSDLHKKRVDDPLILRFSRFWKLISLYQKKEAYQALFLGGGAFAMPMDVCRIFPSSKVQVLELDPEVIQTAKDYLQLKEDACLQTTAIDARKGLRQQKDQALDFIFGDAYHGVRSIPSHMVTKEFFQLIHQKLKPQGFYLMNMISAFTGEKSLFFQAMYKTIKEVFPSIHVYLVEKDYPREIQNVIIVASKDRELPDPYSLFSLQRDFFYEIGIDALIRHYVSVNPSSFDQRLSIFTDEKNASEYLLVKSLWP
jgi:tRNA G46 methylase TrmB